MTLNEPTAGGGRAYALVAWIWAFIWFIPLDGIKWTMAYILNEDGFRDRMHGRDPASMATSGPPVVIGEGDGLAPAEGNPNVGRNSLGRVSAGVRPSIGRNSVQVTPPPPPFAWGDCSQLRGTMPPMRMTTRPAAETQGPWAAV